MSTGLAWNPTLMPSSAVWGSIAFGNGRFVAIEAVGAPTTTQKAAYSLDGITWVASTLPSVQSWQEVAFGGGSFVAVCNGFAAHSSDGISWTQVALANSSNLWDCVAGDNVTGTVIINGDLNGTPHNFGLYSTNGGASWSNMNATALFPSYGPGNLAAGNGHFIQILASGSSIGVHYGTDGINWTFTGVNANFGNPQAVYDPTQKLFVAWPTTNLHLTYSTDGSSWALANDSAIVHPSANPHTVAAGGGWWVEFEDSVSTQCSFSSDSGATWTGITAYPLPTADEWIGCWGNPSGSVTGMFVAIAGHKSGASNHAAYTTPTAAGQQWVGMV